MYWPRTTYRRRIQVKKARVFLAAAMGLMIAAGVVIDASAQTSLPVAAPDALSKILNSRAEIEKDVILATPDSLARAVNGINQSKLLGEDEKAAMREVLRGISSILYPSAPSARTEKALSLAKGKTEETSLSFHVDPSLSNIGKSDALCLTQLVEASQGKVFAAPKGVECTFINELLPALAIFRTSDKEITRAALGYAERFEASSGLPSVIPGLVKARFAVNSGDTLQAYGQYRQILEAHPDVWPARLSLGILSLQLDQPVNALSYLTPLAESRANDPLFIASQGLALYWNARFAAAEALLKKASGFEAPSNEVLLAYAHILLDRNDAAGAQPLLDAAGKKSTEDRMYAYLKAILARNAGRKDEALKWARKALQSKPSDPEMMVLLAGLLFSGPDQGREEAILLVKEAIRLFETESDAGRAPLELAMREEAEGEAARYLLLDAYNHQEWYAAAELLEVQGTEVLDKTVVATILRKSGKSKEAVEFSSEWFAQAPESEAAAEAYLRSLASSSVASADSGSVSDALPGLLGVLSSAGATGLGSNDTQANLVGLVLRLLSGSYSARMRSYLHYLRGSLQSDPNAAIDSYRMALLERGDNVEALIALAFAYYEKGDTQKALFYTKQAKQIGTSDRDLEDRLLVLEKSILAEQSSLSQ